MRILPFFCLVLGCCLAAPSDSGEYTDSIVITEDFINKDDIIYTGKHDIVRIFAPFNQFPFKKSELWDDWVTVTDNDSSGEEKEEECPKYTVFFVEADINNGVKTYQGLYVQKNGQVTKLLGNGRDAVANNENVIYFGAADGIYKYNEAANTAEKHGAVTDDIIQLAFYNVTNTIYYVTASHELYKLNTEATSSVKVPAAKDVQALVFGYGGKIYYYDSKKEVYVFDEVNNEEPVKITGLPDNAGKFVLISPVVGMEKGAVLLVDKVVYFVQPNGKASKSMIVLELAATAYEPKPTLIQYLAKDKKLYQLDVYAVLKRSKDQLPESVRKQVELLPSANCKKTV